MTTIFRSAVTIAAALLLAPAAPAHATTWYVAGHLDPQNLGNPLDARLAAALPGDMPFIGSFTFDSGAVALNVIPGMRTDFVTDTAHGGATMLQLGGATYATASSRIIEQYLFNGEQLTLNANVTPTGGTPVAGLELLGLDLFSVAHYGPQSASVSEKWPWYTPGQIPTALPDLASVPADSVPQMVLFYFDPAAGSYVSRVGFVDGLALTPFSLPAVPEPSGARLFVAGLALFAFMQRRRG